MIGMPESNITETVSLDNFSNVGQIVWTQGGTLQSDHTTVAGVLVQGPLTPNATGKMIHQKGMNRARNRRDG